MAKKRSASPKTQLKRALRALEKGQTQRALRQLERLLPQVRGDPGLAEEVHRAIADASLSLRELPQTIRHAEAALALNAENDQAYYLLGFAHSVNQNWPEAIAALRQAQSLDPDNPEYTRSLGWALSYQGDDQEGLMLLEQALEMAPTYVPTLTDLAMLYGSEGRYEQALIYARRAAQLAPSDQMVQDVLARLTHFQGEYERLGGPPTSKAPERPSTEAEWREAIAATDDINELMQLWVELHPADDLDGLNASLVEFNALWNSTPRPELGGRSPNDMMDRGGDAR